MKLITSVCLWSKLLMNFYQLHPTRNFIKDPKLKSLCKTEKHGRNGRVLVNHQMDLLQKLKGNRVRYFVSRSRTRRERSEIQNCDLLFRKSDHLHFKTPKHHSSCRKLLIDGDHFTNELDIANHFESFYCALANSNTASLNLVSNIPLLEERSFGHCDQIIDVEIDIEEIEGASKLLKPNRSGGPDGLKAEHFKYGGGHLKLWLKQILNCILVLEDIPQCMKDGLVFPVYKRQGYH